MTLMGVLPLGKPVDLGGGRSLLFEENNLDDWVHGGFTEIPVLWRHDHLSPAGWITDVRIHRDQLWFHGDWDDTFDPFAGRVRDLIRQRYVTGLSPLVTRTRGLRKYGTGRWGEGELLSIDEVSVTPHPHMSSARWLTA